MDTFQFTKPSFCREATQKQIKNPRYFRAFIETYHLFQVKCDRAVRKQKNDMIYIPSTLAVAQFKLIYKPDGKNMYYTHVYIFIFIYIYTHIHKIVQSDSHVTKKKKKSRSLKYKKIN